MYFKSNSTKWAVMRLMTHGLGFHFGKRNCLSHWGSLGLAPRIPPGDPPQKAVRRVEVIIWTRSLLETRQNVVTRGARLTYRTVRWRKEGSSHPDLESDILRHHCSSRSSRLWRSRRAIPSGHIFYTPKSILFTV